jgi:hypothetical protein
LICGRDQDGGNLNLSSIVVIIIRGALFCNIKINTLKISDPKPNPRVDCIGIYTGYYVGSNAIHYKDPNDK